MSDPRLYFLGIAGTAMASVAVALARAGYRVTGSDRGVYPPMSDYLTENGIIYHESFDAMHIDERIDLLVVGNAISRGNVELEEALDRSIPYLSLPQIIRTHLIADKTSIVIAGTHGKTTTTSLVAWLLEVAGMKPGFLVGGIPNNFGCGCRMPEAKHIVLEGDEYDTAFFDKRSKFLHYAPAVAVINNIEYDHADIFSSLDDVKKSFRALVDLIPRDGCAFVNGDDAHIREVARGAPCPVESYGFTAGNAWHAEIIGTKDHRAIIELRSRHNESEQFIVAQPGLVQVYNSLAAIAVARWCGIEREAIQEGLDTFRGVRRRMELIGTVRGVTLIEDFAHHPTAIKATINAAREMYPCARVWALFEPRSNTSTRNIFQKEFLRSFSDADVTIIGAVHRAERYPIEQRLDVEALVSALKAIGKEAHAIADADELAAFVSTHAMRNDVVLIMSNGEFGGVKQKIAARLNNG